VVGELVSLIARDYVDLVISSLLGRPVVVNATLSVDVDFSVRILRDQGSVTRICDEQKK
jgi:hypothetical protein